MSRTTLQHWDIYVVHNFTQNLLCSGCSPSMIFYMVGSRTLAVALCSQERIQCGGNPPITISQVFGVVAIFVPSSHFSFLSGPFSFIIIIISIIIISFVTKFCYLNIAPSSWPVARTCGGNVRCCLFCCRIECSSRDRRVCHKMLLHRIKLLSQAFVSFLMKFVL